MKREFKRLVCGVAFLCAGVAHAAVTSVVADGVTNHGGFKVEASSDWVFSSYLMGTLDTAGASLVSSNGVDLIQDVRPLVDEFGEPYLESYYTLRSDVSTLTVDGGAGKVVTAQSVGGVTMSTSKSMPLRMGGGWAELGELEVRFQADGSVNVFGVITGRGQPLYASSAVGVSYSGLVFTVKASDVERPATFAGVAGTQQTILHNLALSTPGLNALATSWGLISTGLMHAALKQAATNFGDLKLTVQVSAVPEPSSWALLAVGVLGLGLAGHRRTR